MSGSLEKNVVMDNSYIREKDFQNQKINKYISIWDVTKATLRNLQH